MSEQQPDVVVVDDPQHHSEGSYCGLCNGWVGGGEALKLHLLHDHEPGDIGTSTRGPEQPTTQRAPAD